MKSTGSGKAWSHSLSGSFASRAGRTSLSVIEPERPRTTLANLPGDIRAWVENRLGAGEVTPVDGLVNTNHCFRVDVRDGIFFVKVLQRPDAAVRLRREVVVLEALRDSRLPVPELVTHDVFDRACGVLVTRWLDALPARYLDYQGRHALDYLEALGDLLARFHRSVARLILDPRETPRGFSDLPDPEALDRAARHYLGPADARVFHRHYEHARQWIGMTRHQVIHGDVQDKNILLDDRGAPHICDFESVREGPIVQDLSVDRIYLKRTLPEPARAVLQRALISGYGAHAELFGPAHAALDRLLRLGQLMPWRYPEPDSKFRARFDSILAFL